MIRVYPRRKEAAPAKLFYQHTHSLRMFMLDQNANPHQEASKVGTLTQVFEVANTLAQLIALAKCRALSGVWQTVWARLRPHRSDAPQRGACGGLNVLDLAVQQMPAGRPKVLSPSRWRPPESWTRLRQPTYRRISGGPAGLPARGCSLFHGASGSPSPTRTWWRRSTGSADCRCNSNTRSMGLLMGTSRRVRRARWSGVSRVGSGLCCRTSCRKWCANF